MEPSPVHLASVFLYTCTRISNVDKEEAEDTNAYQPIERRQMPTP